MALFISLFLPPWPWLVVVVEWFFYFKRIIIVRWADLSDFFSFIFVGKMCVFVSRPMKNVTFLLKIADHLKRVVDFPRERDTFRNKIMEIVEDFDEKSYNNNGKSWKSSRILRVNPFFSFFFLFSSFFIIFPHFLSFFLIFSFSFIFYHFLSFSFIFFRFLSFSSIFFYFFIFFYFLSFSFIFYHFLSFFFHFLSFVFHFSFIFFHFLSFSFIFFHFLSFSFIFFVFVLCSKSDFFRASISLRFLLTVLM